MNAAHDTTHHIQQSLCTNRPPYRQGRKLTAVKVYTTATESQHLFIYGVPKLNLKNELKSMCHNYGQVYTIHAVADVEVEAFTECYHVHYQRIQSARIAKRFLDNKSFYGGVLHVCYVPEYETADELRYKLLLRQHDIRKRLFGEEHSRKPEFKLNETKTCCKKRHLTSDNNVTQFSNKKKKQKFEDGVDPLLASSRQELIENKTDNRQIIESTNLTVEKVKVYIQPRRFIGPQLPPSEKLIDNRNLILQTTLLPTQIMLSKEYKHIPTKQNVKRLKKDAHN